MKSPDIEMLYAMSRARDRLYETGYHQLRNTAYEVVDSFTWVRILLDIVQVTHRVTHTARTHTSNLDVDQSLAALPEETL